MVAPAGVPAEYIEVLDKAIAKITSSEEFKKKADEAGLLLHYMDTKAFAAHWDDLDKQSMPLIELAKSEKK